MALMFDPVTILNFIFCVIIVTLGYWEYKRKESLIALYIAITFALFGIAHLCLILGVNSSNIFVLIIRSIGYLVIIYALYKVVSGHWDK